MKNLSYLLNNKLVFLPVLSRETKNINVLISINEDDILPLLKSWNVANHPGLRLVNSVIFKISEVISQKGINDTVKMNYVRELSMHLEKLLSFITEDEIIIPEKCNTLIEIISHLNWLSGHMTTDFVFKTNIVRYVDCMLSVNDPGTRWLFAQILNKPH